MTKVYIALTSKSTYFITFLYKSLWGGVVRERTMPKYCREAFDKFIRVAYGDFTKFT